MQQFDPKCDGLPPELLAPLMAALGRCLFLYQRIEVLLKALLPHFSHPEAGPRGEGPVQWRQLLDSKLTLGPLMELFKGRSSLSSPEAIDAYLRKLVQQRNDVVHHFLTDPARPIITEADLHDAVRRLDEYLEFGAPLLAVLQGAAIAFLNALDTEQPGSRHTLTLQVPLPGASAP